MSLNRRSFLKLAGITGIAVVAPSLILPKARTILNPEAKIYLPPVGGWLATSSAEVVAMQMLADINNFTRSITLNGTFPPGTLATLTSERYDPHRDAMAIVTMSRMLLSQQAGTLVFTDIPAGSRGLVVTLDSDLNNLNNHGNGGIRYTFHDDWRGDFVRNISSSNVSPWQHMHPAYIDTRTSRGVLVEPLIG